MSESSEQIEARSSDDLTPPTVRDSDFIRMAISRLERAETKMQAFEYDAELERHLTESADWMAYLIGRRFPETGAGQ